MADFNDDDEVIMFNLCMLWDKINLFDRMFVNI